MKLSSIGHSILLLAGFAVELSFLALHASFFPQFYNKKMVLVTPVLNCVIRGFSTWCGGSGLIRLSTVACVNDFSAYGKLLLLLVNLET